MNTKRIRTALCAGLLLHLLWSPNVRGGYWQTTVVGSLDEPASVSWPQVSDGRVAWNGGYGTDSEIFVYENGVTTRLTNDHLRDQLIGIAGNHVAWSEYVTAQDGSETVNLVLDGKTVAEGLPYDNVSLSSGGLAWALGSNVNFSDGLDTHTFVYPGTSGNYNPNASGSRVVWSGFDQDFKNRAYMYDGTQVVQLPDGVGIGQQPHIDGDNVTGILVNDSDYIMGVTRYNLATGRLDKFPSEIRFTTTPSISGKQMVWVVDDISGTGQVFALDSQGTPVQVTNSGYKFGPYVTDSFVAWTGPDPDGGIFTFDRTSVSKVPAPDAFSVTDADKNSLVWLQHDGLNYNIVLATYVTPEPSSIAMAGIAVVSGLLLARKSRKF